MKTAILSIIACLFLLPSSIDAQNTWKGNTPGKALEWDCPSNWSLNRVPDSWDDVVVPDLYAKGEVYPIIKNEAEVQSLLLVGGAEIHIKRGGSLHIDGSATLKHGLVNAGLLRNEGKILIADAGLEPIISVGSGHIEGDGELSFETSPGVADKAKLEDLIATHNSK